MPADRAERATPSAAPLGRVGRAVRPGDGTCRYLGGYQPVDILVVRDWLDSVA